MDNNSPSGKILINGSTGQRLVSKEQSSFTLYPDEVAVFALNGTTTQGVDVSNTYGILGSLHHYTVINLYTPKYHDDGTLNGVPEKIELFENVNGLGEKVTWDSNLGDTSGYFIHLQINDFRMDGYRFLRINRVDCK